MRVTIQIDDEEASMTGAEGGTPPGRSSIGQPLAADAAADAGAGPGDGSTSGEAVAADTGGPPDWLLDAVGKAEADAGGVSDTGGADGLDAGAGPSV